MESANFVKKELDTTTTDWNVGLFVEDMLTMKRKREVACVTLVITLLMDIVKFVEKTKFI